MRATRAKVGHLFVYHPEQRCYYWRCTRDDYLWDELVSPAVNLYIGYYMIDQLPPPQDLRHDKWENWVKHKCEFKKQFRDEASDEF